MPGFLENAASHYGAAIQPIDLDDGAAAAETINGWISDTTRGLIPTIVTERVVLRQELVLVNTVYLKADWIEPFPPRVDQERPVHHQRPPRGDSAVHARPGTGPSSLRPTRRCRCG